MLMKIKRCGYIIGVLVFALGFESCQVQDDDLGNGQYPILFGNTNTRALSGLDNLKNDGFQVHAYYERSGNKVGTFQKEVTYQSGQNVWGYEGLEYWISGADYWFNAFYPSTSSAYILTNTDASYTITDFDITEQVDIMAASTSCTVNEGETCPESGSVVNLTFDHLLACVVIEMRSQIPDITISKITLGNVANNGDYNGNTWSSSSTCSFEHESGVTLTMGNLEYIDVTNGGILVIPETVTSQTLTIEASNKTYQVTFPAGTWTKGQKYAYTAEIKQSDIVFADSPKVDVWDSESATGSVIIK